MFESLMGYFKHKKLKIKLFTKYKGSKKSPETNKYLLKELEKDFYKSKTGYCLYYTQ